MEGFGGKVRGMRSMSHYEIFAAIVTTSYYNTQCDIVTLYNEP